MRISPILILHICGGIVGLLSGAAAMSFRKGSRRHSAAGNVFVIAMLCMSASATYLAVMKSSMNIFGGILTFYLVATAWMTARRRDGKPAIFDYAALLVPLAIAACLLIFGLEAAHGQRTLLDGESVKGDYIVAFVALLFAMGDIRMLILGGVFGIQRVVRHLLRMCLALFVATGSFFLGQQKVMPTFIQGSPILLVPALLPLVLMIFWLFRVRFTNAYKTIASAS